ncbi:hypothetical protein K1T71_000290 [Dendrolimus kikuchii]|uniref:Uncharacterized protein n=1 Tax=Dendrolimus kikuchii TaxID=765133 RepID=A0ACC1DJS3_9NEOP|nr:hypothetical protein K1T71_000290 [Dendrolimus kikuchii]
MLQTLSALFRKDNSEFQVHVATTVHCTMMASIAPRSCDTFVVLPNLTKEKRIIFGKNSDRPQNEVQEVIFFGGKRLASKLKCTFITIDESIADINSVILSKPAWLWGAEMGVNDKNVTIGNEAVWTNNNEGDGDASHKRLLGMDLVRLGLERGNTAEDALNVITTLLEKYGQGGPCSEFDDSLFYHNSFLIVDCKQAWVLETSGKLWAAEKIETGYRNISNCLSITTKIDKHSEGLKEKALTMGLWDGQSEFNFTKCFSSGGDEIRYHEGEKLLRNTTIKAEFKVEDMFNILRHKESHICRSCDDAFPTQASQVSSLSAEGINIHWFTATPDPSLSFFKPFVFAPNTSTSSFTHSPNMPGREHDLYSLHKKIVLKANTEEIEKNIQDLETEWLKKVVDLTKPGQESMETLGNIFKDSVKAEVELYESLS